MQPLITNYLSNNNISNDCISILDTPETIIYKHKSLVSKYSKNNDFFGIFSESDILPGTLLIIEKGYIGEHTYQASILKNNKNLRTHLYPRNTDSVHDKIKYNAFEWYDNKRDHIELKDTNVIFSVISKINHNCKPNTGCVRFIRDEFIDEYENDMGDPEYYINGGFILYAIDYIPKGSEIFITYDYNAGHGHECFNWKCNCNSKIQTLQKDWSDNCRKLRNYYNNDINNIKNIILNT